MCRFAKLGGLRLLSIVSYYIIPTIAHGRLSRPLGLYARKIFRLRVLDVGSTINYEVQRVYAGSKGIKEVQTIRPLMGLLLEIDK